MASSTSALTRFQSACVTCVRGGKRAVLHYRDFLLNPGTLFTLASLLLLIAASIQTPDGLVNSAHAHTWLYLAVALAGSVYIWWSALQGIRERDFTGISRSRLPRQQPSSSASILPPPSLRCSCSWVGCWKSLSLPELLMPWTSFQSCSLTG